MYQRLLTLWRQWHARPMTRPSGHRPHTSERRIWRRYSSRLKTTVQVIQSAEAARLPAQVRNISAGGIQLAIRRVLEMGTLLHVDLPGLATTSSLLASVVHVTLPADGTWTLGCSFIRELNDAELRALL